MPEMCLNIFFPGLTLSIYNKGRRKLDIGCEKK